jgi:putative membrane protein
MDDSRERLDVDIRFLLANERTLLAWIRTALTLLAGGVALIYLTVDLFPLGIVLIAVGTAAAVVGYRRYEAAERAIRAGRMIRRGWGPALVTVGVVIIGVLLLIGVILFRPTGGGA